MCIPWKIWYNRVNSPFKHCSFSLPFMYAVAGLRSEEYSLLLPAASRVTMMLIALKSIFSLLYNQSHCPIITPPPTIHCVSIFCAFMPHYWHAGEMCACLCTHGQVCVQFYCLGVCQCALIRPHGICISLYVCCVEMLVSVLVAIY